MKRYSKKWVNSFLDGTLPDNKTILDTMSKKAFEVESVEESADGDSLFEIKVLPNRVADAMSLEGMAKEMSALFNIKLKDHKLKIDLSEYKKDDSYVDIQGDNQPVNIFTGLKVKFDNSIETPDWIKDILVKSGGRSINCLVDITNLMLFAFGQPAHVFDFEKLKGHLVTRYAKDGEEMELLDGRRIKMNSSDYVIADEERALSLAGIKGGKLAEVDTKTTLGIFEMANFNPTMIRKSSTRLAVRTDASKIFENGIATTVTEGALSILVSTIKDIQPSAEIEFIFSKKIVDKQSTWVNLQFSDINNFAGKTLDKKEILELLARQNFEVKEDGEKLQVKAPSERLDINLAEDVAEEALRIYGFDNIESRELRLKGPVDQNKRFLFENYFKQKMVSKGYTEVFNYTFVSEGPVKVKLGIASDKEHLRYDLSEGAKNAFTKNYNYLPVLETDTVKFFEIGTVFLDDSAEEKRAVIVCEDNKKKTKYLGDIETILTEIETELGLSKINDIEKSEKPALLEFSIDKIVKEVEEKGITIPFVETTKSLQDIKYKPISIYPFIVRDIAMFVPAGFDFENLKKALKELNLANVEKIYMFDSFTKDDKTSVAFRIIFQSYEKTLTDVEVENEMGKVNEYLKENSYIIR